MFRKTIALFLLAVLTLALFCGCSYENFEMKQKNPEIDTFVEDLMSSVSSGEHDAFIIKYFGTENVSDFSDVLDEISENIQGDMTRYRYVRYDINTMKSGDSPAITKTTYIYIIDTDASAYTLTITTLSQSEQTYFQSFYIQDGGIENLTGSTFGKSPAQTVLWVYSILCYGLIIFAIIACAKSRVRKKALWIIGSFFQSGFSIAQTVSDSSFRHSFNFLFAKIGISSLNLYPSESFELMIVFPIVALIFLLIKNRLEKKADIYREKKSAAETKTTLSESTTDTPVTES